MDLMMIRRVTKRTMAWVFALAATVLLTMAPSAMASPRAMVADGVYQIAFGSRDELLTSEPRVGSAALLLPPDESGYQDWQIEPNGGGYTIRNVRSGLFLGFSEAPEPYRFAVVTPVPYEWNVWPVFGNRVVVSIPVPGGELRLDRSPIMTFPARVDVQWPHPGQEWALLRLG
jgi:hypothetical protein